MPRIESLDPTKNGRQAEHLEKKLRHLIVGRDEAMRQIARAYHIHLAGLAPVRRPIGELLPVRPIRFGKTRIVEAASESLLKDSRSVIKNDCAEFQYAHEIAKLIGSPPGHLGRRETHSLLSPEALNQSHTNTTKLSFVLFEEIDNASDALWNLLLGILDKATLTLSDNRNFDFSAAIVFLTSNLGAAEMSSLVIPRLGFHARSVDDRGSSDKLTAWISSAGVAAGRRKVTARSLILSWRWCNSISRPLPQTKRSCLTLAIPPGKSCWWRAPLPDMARDEARYRARARPTIVEPDGEGPDSPWRLHPRKLQGRISCSEFWREREAVQAWGAVGLAA